MMRSATIAVVFFLFSCAEPVEVGWSVERAALDGEPVQVSLSVMATYEDRTPLVNGGEDVVIRPIRCAWFEVLGAGDELLAHGVTGDGGAAAVTFDGVAGEEIRVRILALSGRRDMTVAVRNDEYAIHAVESGAAPADDEIEINVHAGAAGAGAAFNIFDRVSSAVAGLADRYGPVKGLDVVWTPGVPHPCGSCFLPWGGVMLVGGGDADPDQWDDSVILHELGHWFEENLAATTNPGGAHDGVPTFPDVAWSEGFASFFGQALIGSPVYLDSFGEGTWSMDLERMGGSHAWGTEDGALDGFVSENLVSAILWDLFDDGEPEPHDHLAAGLFIVLDPAVDWLGADGFVDVGYDGVDLADYLTGWLVSGKGRWTSVAQIVVARDYPYPFRAPPMPTP